MRPEHGWQFERARAHRAHRAARQHRSRLPPPATPRTNADADCSVAKCIALTFDDGPGPDTGRLLDLLKAQNVPATFFVLGNQAVKYPATVHREYAEGNEVGNHTWDHKDLSKLPAAGVQDEINRGADAIAAAGIPRPTLVRPPYGAVNDTVRAVGGYPFIMWRVDPEDWKYPDPARDRGPDRRPRQAGPHRVVPRHAQNHGRRDTRGDPAAQAAGVHVRHGQHADEGGRACENGKSYFNRPAAITGQGGQDGMRVQSRRRRSTRPPSGPVGGSSG